MNRRKLPHATPTRLAIAIAACLPAAGWAQTAAPAAAASAPSAGTATAQTVEITARTGATQVGGFDAPAARTPLATTSIATDTLTDLGNAQLGAVTRLDAAVSDAYNAVGYWTSFTVRGFTLDNRQNFLRDGLPINAETALPLANKSSVEVLKGLSGMQAGTSTPGGLVNLVVKRPDAVDHRELLVYGGDSGTKGLSVDWSQRLGDARQFGLRLNADVAKLQPREHAADGHRNLMAVAADWRIGAGQQLELEFEHSLQNQPSVPAFSMLGDTLPAPQSVDPRTNLNDQRWSLPVVMQGNTASVRFTQALAAGWTLKAHAATQRLVSNDHLAFPYGYTDCTVCDRYAADGTYSIWDYRSDNERRRSDAVDVSADGELATGPLRHHLSLGVLTSHYSGRFNDQAYNLVGVGTVDGKTQVPADPSLTSPSANLDQRSSELYLRDHVEIAEDWSAWLGLRHTRLHRQSVPTSMGDPAEATDYRQSFTSPFAAVSRQLTPQDMAYLSAGRGFESDVTPQQGGYAHPGQALPATISRQWEAGWKHAEGQIRYGLTWFDVRQPQGVDVATDAGLVRSFDGDLRARGLEAQWQWQTGPLGFSASLLRERMAREKAASGNGLVPYNVPTHSWKSQVDWRVDAVPGLSLRANLTHEGPRAVTPDDTIWIPDWTRVDLGLRYLQTVGRQTWTWRVGVDNVADRRAWRESPYQYGHIYLFPMQARSAQISLQVGL